MYSVPRPPVNRRRAILAILALCLACALGLAALVAAAHAAAASASPSHHTYTTTTTCPPKQTTTTAEDVPTTTVADATTTTVDATTTVPDVTSTTKVAGTTIVPTSSTFFPPTTHPGSGEDRPTTTAMVGSPPPGADRSGTGGTLPHTGSPVVGLVLVGLVSLAAGAALQARRKIDRRYR